jgi:hypothetical protein
VLLSLRLHLLALLPLLCVALAVTALRRLAWS